MLSTPVASFSAEELLGKGWIYRLLDKSVPEEHEGYCFYVGLTQDNLRDRIRCHLFNAVPTVQKKVNQVLEHGKLHIEGLAYLDASDLDDAETHFIWEHQKAGYSLANAQKIKVDELRHKKIKSELEAKYPQLFGLDVAVSEKDTRELRTSFIDSLKAELLEEREKYIAARNKVEQDYTRAMLDLEAREQGLVQFLGKTIGQLSVTMGKLGVPLGRARGAAVPTKVVPLEKPKKDNRSSLRSRVTLFPDRILDEIDAVVRMGRGAVVARRVITQKYNGGLVTPSRDALEKYIRHRRKFFGVERTVDSTSL